MGDRPLDDTKQPSPAPRPPRAPGAYYYDDQTGYEPYDPSLDEDNDEKKNDERPETPAR
jgi:hypothetical protein